MRFSAAKVDEYRLSPPSALRVKEAGSRVSMIGVSLRCRRSPALSLEMGRKRSMFCVAFSGSMSRTRIRAGCSNGGACVVVAQNWTASDG